MFLPLVREAKETNKNLLFLKLLKLNSSHHKQNRTLPPVAQEQKTNKKPLHHLGMPVVTPCQTVNMTRRNNKDSSRPHLPLGEMLENLKKRLNRKKLIKILRKCDLLVKKTKNQSKQLKNRNPRQKPKRMVRNRKNLSCSVISVRMTTVALCGTQLTSLSSMIK